MPVLQQLRRNLIKAIQNSSLLRSLSGAAAAQAVPAHSRAFTEPLLYRDFIHQSLYHPVSVAVPLGRWMHCLWHAVVVDTPGSNATHILLPTCVGAWVLQPFQPPNPAPASALKLQPAAEPGRVQIRAVKGLQAAAGVAAEAAAASLALHVCGGS